MRPKLQPAPHPNVLRIGYEPQWLLGQQPVYLRYANHRFGRTNSRETERFLDSVEFSRWTDERTLRFLEEHQQEFRRCLEWLANGSVTNMGIDDDESDEFSSAMRDKWAQVPEVKFLQEHGLNHGGVTLWPYSQDGSFFGGIQLSQRKPRDPLDVICWEMLSALMWKGNIGVRRCGFCDCPRFIRPLTSRKLFCSNLCRAKHHMNKMPLEAKAAYMRRYRAISNVKKRA